MKVEEKCSLFTCTCACGTIFKVVFTIILNQKDRYKYMESRGADSFKEFIKKIIVKKEYLIRTSDIFKLD